MVDRANVDSEEQEEVPLEGLRRFGHYTILSELGRGAQGIVYLAEDSTLRRKVALKLLSAAGAQTEVARERFQREAELASKLSHPGICGVHEFGIQDDVPFIAMQYLQGTTLEEMIQEAKDSGNSGHSVSGSLGGGSSTGAISKAGLQELLRIFEKTAGALHAAHMAGLVHRDIKPANIMVSKGGNPVILDFGLARDIGDEGETLTQSGQIMGTPAYMAWEQILGKRDKVDSRTDVYALGVTLYECLTLRRPYEADAFEQLYQLILQGAPANPRKREPRLPKDLGTVVEVAMDRERSRRYSTAIELAEDLRRVRSFEPIRAKAASTWTRMFKWTRRNPAPSVGIAALLLFALIGAGMILQQGINDRQETAEQLRIAEEAMAAKDPIRATEALARVRGRDSDSLRAVELAAELDVLRGELEEQAREEEARAGAKEAREESLEHQQAYAEKRAEAERLRTALEAERPQVFGLYATAGVRAEFALKESEVDAALLDAERSIQQAREALERAARLEAPWGGSDGNRAAFADFYFSRWQEATESGDPNRAELYRAQVERYDTDGDLETQLQGHGFLSVAVTPTNAELYLFRYEPYGDFRPGQDVPRLVPVPTAGIGRSREGEWISGFAPGDACLVIDGVQASSPAEGAGLLPGDLVLSIDGKPAAGGLFICDLPGVDFEDLPARVLALNDLDVHDILDWGGALRRRAEDSDLVLLHSRDEWLECDAQGVTTSTAVDLLARGCAIAPMRVECLRGGVPLVFELGEGELSGLECSETAYPLLRSSENQLTAATQVVLEPGSYLLVAGAKGSEELRYPFMVPRLGRVNLALSLLPEGMTPPGFIRIPAGAFLAGGDELAKEPLPMTEEVLDEFFISRLELTNAEWFEFLEDPEIAVRVRASKGKRYVPRERDGPMPQQNLGGPETPVMGISLDDLEEYLVWRNERAEEDGEPWIYDLPSELEWEKAARGADGRSFPWGWRFDYSATTGLHSRIQPNFDSPGGFEHRDESPYGLLDMGGHRREWTRDWYRPSPEAPRIQRQRGGHWRSAREDDFRVSSRQFAGRDWVDASYGARLIARRRD